MRELAERLTQARDLVTLGESLADECERSLPFSLFTFAAFEPRVATLPASTLRSHAHAPAAIAAHLAPMLLAVDREYPGGLAAILAAERAFDLYAQLPIRSIERTEMWREHWLPTGCHQQLVAPLHRGDRPVGYFAVSRHSREPRFTPEDLRLLESLRALVERAALGLATLGAGELGPTLEALAHAFPHPAFLYGPGGRLLWMSTEGALRLDVQAARVGSGLLVRGNAGLEDLTRCARALEDHPAFRPEGPLRRSGALRGGERLALRRFLQPEGMLLLLAIVPALASLPGDPAGAAPPGLGAVEWRVARLAAEGYTVLNVASLLGVSESTVRTHLRRVYLKLGVHGRAELATLLSRGGGPAQAARPPGEDAGG